MYDPLVSIMMLVIVVCIVIGIILGPKKDNVKQQSILPLKITIEQPKPQPKLQPQPKVIIKEVVRYIDRPTPTKLIAPKKPKVDKSAFNEAKQCLMSMGYSSSAAKQLLDSVGYCSTSEEYVQKVLSKKRG